MFSKKSIAKNWFLAVMFSLLAISISAQNNSMVQGIITDSNNVPISGATILNSSTYKGAITLDDGTFTLEAAQGTELIVDCIGFVSKKVMVSGQKQLIIVLETDLLSLEELVVVGYGSVRKKDLTGSVSSVNSKVLEDRPVSNLGQALQGRASGVYIVDNGNPQANVSLKIRGMGTVNNSDPLYVIDGVPMAIMGMNSLNPEDIESIDILKDASATAIYGARGANGVVMITTRHGKKGDGQVQFNASYGVSMATSTPALLDAAQYAALNNDMMLASGNNTNPLWTDPSTLGAGTNWIDEMLRTAYAQHYTLSYSGGTEKDTYYISGSYSSYDGIVNSVGYERATFQYSGTNNVKSWLRMTTNVTMSYDNKTNGDYSIGDLLKSVPVIPVLDENGKYDGPTGNALWYGDKANQVGKSNINKNSTNGYNLLATETAEISITDGLKFKSVGSVGLTMVYDDSFRPAYNWKPTPLLETERYKKATKMFSYLFDNYFTYNKFFGAHSVNAMLGSSLQWGSSDWFSGQKKDFLSDSATQFNNGNEIESLDGTVSAWAIASFMGRINYSYDNRYLFTATLRYDGSSKFGPGHRWGAFPSFSAAWNIAQEDWFNFNPISNLKLRAGYGVTGNQEIGDYSFVSVYNTGQYSFNGNVVNSLVINKLSNMNIHWEEVAQTNIGLDLGLWENRLSVAVDAYIKNTNGMLVPMVVPISSGYSDTEVPYTNAGKVQNKGVEFTITSDNLRGKEVSWQTNFNMSFNKNKILSLDASDVIYYNDAGFGQYFCTNMVGQPIGSFYGWETNGIFQSQEEVDNYASQSGAAPGDIRFKDSHDNGIINDQDRTIIGNPQPLFTYALGNTLTWKGFDMEIFFQGVYGNTIFNALKVEMESMSTVCNQYASVANRWTGPGTSTTIPRAIYGDPNNNNRPSTRFLEDGSYLRLKNLSIGYTLPKSISHKIGLSKLRVYFAGNNLWTLTSYTGFDPEVGNDGIDWGTYPITRTFSFGVDVNF